MTRIALCAVLALTAGRLSAEETKATKPQEATSQGAKAASTSKPEADLLEIEKNIVKFTNYERARHGLPPLEVDPELMKTAREQGIWMARFRRLQHTRRPLAENIAMGYGSSQSVVRGWMNSSGHRANILNGSHRRIGVAAYVTDGGTIYWCQQFRR
ncbi:MAG: hypothetical protein JW818_23710 [Pirellulales bacterium]|nr:hypothetical protein [Pirellulales bacterium]